MLVTWVIAVLIVNVGDAHSSRRPSLHDLVDTADIILIGDPESLQLTRLALCFRIARVICLLVSAFFIMRSLAKRRLAEAALYGLCTFVVFSIIEPPIGTYQRVAHVSVSSILKGPPALERISLYYDEVHTYINMHFEVDRPYLLFLKQVPNGYAPVRLQWSVWGINAERIQAESTARPGARPLLVADLLAKIDELAAAPADPLRDVGPQGIGDQRQSGGADTCSGEL